MTDQAALDAFVDMSVLLTGISKEKLAPADDPINLKQTFFELCDQRAGSVFTDLISFYALRAAQNQSDQDIGNAILKESTEQMSALAGSIIKAWYLGSWVQPFDTDVYNGGDSFVISNQAYKEGWIWRIAQAHPMGYSMEAFGYWQDPPVALSNYTGNERSNDKQGGQ